MQKPKLHFAELTEIIDFCDERPFTLNFPAEKEIKGTMYRSYYPLTSEQYKRIMEYGNTAVINSKMEYSPEQKCEWVFLGSKCFKQ